jgi:glycerol transport system ATP-binding protein
MLELEALRLVADAQPVTHRFAENAISVVLGANRSGKTLLCRCLAGLAQPAAGRMLLDGQDIADTNARQRPVAIVNQAFVNYPAWTVADNIASPLIARGVPGATRRQRVDDIADKLGLAPLLKRFPHELSGGQQQRVAIGRALAKNARVLVLDEPLVNLDYKLREALRDELRALLIQAGMTVIYTTTDPADAFSLGTDVLLFAEHTVLQAGSPIAVYRRPVSLAAAALMSEPTVNKAHRQADLWAIRPEHVRLEPPGSDATENFRLLVEEVETNGGHTFVHGAVDAQPWVLKLPGMVSLPIGTWLPVYVRRQDIMSFKSV